MLSTARIVESFQSAPREISLDEAVERLIILDRYERAMKEMNQGKERTNESAMLDMQEWIRA